MGAAPGARSPPPLTSIIPSKIRAHLPGGKRPLRALPPLAEKIVAVAQVAAKNSMLLLPVTRYAAVILPPAAAAERIRRMVGLRGVSGHPFRRRRRRLTILEAVVASTGKRKI